MVKVLCEQRYVSRGQNVGSRRVSSEWFGVAGKAEAADLFRYVSAPDLHPAAEARVPSRERIPGDDRYPRREMEDSTPRYALLAAWVMTVADAPARTAPSISRWSPPRMPPDG